APLFKRHDRHDLRDCAYATKLRRPDVSLSMVGDAEQLVAFHTMLDHQFIAIFEDVKRQKRAGEKHDGQWKERKLSPAQNVSGRHFMTPSVFRSFADSKHGKESFLRNLDSAYLLHPLLSFFLLLKQFSFARNVAAVAFREHILAHSLYGLSSDDFIADSRLNRDFEELARYKLFHLRNQSSTAVKSRISVNNQGECVYRIARDQNVEFHKIRFLIPG